jgi:hypothetical protein
MKLMFAASPVVDPLFAAVALLCLGILGYLIFEAVRSFQKRRRHRRRRFERRRSAQY